MDNMLNFIDRLKNAIALRERELGTRILKKDLAEAAEVSSSAVTYWFKGAEGGGTNELKAGSILGLARYLKVRVEWLRDNDGPMRPADAKPAESAAAQSDVNLSKEAKRLIGMIESADRNRSVSSDVMGAFAIIFGSAMSPGTGARNVGRARTSARLEKLILKGQPARRRKAK
ncbi:hypothetical protein [Paraburkholderia sp. 2C]